MNMHMHEREEQRESETDVQGQDDGQNVWDGDSDSKDDDDQPDNEEGQRGDQDIVHSSYTLNWPRKKCIWMSSFCCCPILIFHQRQCVVENVKRSVGKKLWFGRMWMGKRM